MKTLLPAFFLFSLLIACSEETAQSDMPDELWKIRALEIEVTELDKQNTELTRILRKMNSNHFSLRPLTTELIGELEKIKTQIKNMAEGIFDKEISSSYQKLSKNHYPATITFKNKKVPKALSLLVNHCVTEYDKHPQSDGQLKNSIIDMRSDHFNKSSFRDNELFQDLSLAGSIELLEMIQVRILLQENKYLMGKFDHAINRMYMGIDNSIVQE